MNEVVSKWIIYVVNRNSHYCECFFSCLFLLLGSLNVFSQILHLKSFWLV